MRNRGIKHIILDLGGVIVNLRPEASMEAFKKLGFHRVDETYSDSHQHELFSLYETGKISTSAFLARFREASPDLDVSTEELKAAWNAMILDLPFSRLAFIQSLRREFSLYLLSNTNEIHIDYFYAQLKKDYPDLVFDSLFDRVYYSYLIARRKPDIETYEFVLNDIGISAEETLFIDDSFLNVQEASKLGIKIWHFERNSELSEQWNFILSSC